jgi:Leucine-rich repeat (LRR) protein
MTEKGLNIKSFIEYASSSGLTLDEIYTIELLIERVRNNFDPDYWDDRSARYDAREKSNYKPNFSKKHVAPAAQELQKLSWLSFQRLRDAKRPVRDLKALRFLPALSGLVLINNDISDISAIANCKMLKRLSLSHNPIRDISVLAECANIEDLSLKHIPVSDLAVLQCLPKLRELSLSASQIPAFKRLECLPALRKLEFSLETFDSFKDFPRMPELRMVRFAHVESLDGLEKFPKLENLVSLSGTFVSLEPLRDAKTLTHIKISNSRIDSVEPLARLPALRVFEVNTDAGKLDLTPLKSVPLLHETSVQCRQKELASIKKLRASLSSWDIEFRSSKPRHLPSLELEVVDQETFDVYNSKKPFNLTKADANEEMLKSELQWLDQQIDEFLAGDLAKYLDYEIPCQWGGARSRPVFLFSDEAAGAFPQLVLGIQKILSRAKMDWIIFSQSVDEAEPKFIVWIYPNKIMVAQEYADTVRQLIAQHHNGPRKSR